MHPPNKAGSGAGTAVPASSTSTAFTTAPHQLLTRRVRLVKQHIHAGLPQRPGEEIDLLHELADWLVAEGAAQEIEPAVVSSTSATTTTPLNPPATSKKEK